MGKLTRHRLRYPWDRLKTGGSFFVPGRTPSQLSGAKRNAERRLGWKYECRTHERNGVVGALVTRLPDGSGEIQEDKA